MTDPFSEWLRDESDETLSQKQERMRLLIEQLQGLLNDPDLPSDQRIFCVEQITMNRELIERIS